MNWQRYKDCTLSIPELSFMLDISRVYFPEGYLSEMEPAIQEAYKAMVALEEGAIVNKDEDRMVGHYWLRAPQLAPTPAITQEITNNLTRILDFAKAIHTGSIQGKSGSFKHVLLIGIGGSALGPQFVSQALGGAADKMKLHFFDNTDPDGIDRVVQGLDGQLGQTLSIVVSKSGGTPETRNGMLEAEAAYRRVGLDFEKHAVAITSEDSVLDKKAKKEGWLDTFPMWDWVGGRTSELAAVGLLPAALQGIDIQSMLEGARHMDEVTRRRITSQNPAALLALMWYFITEGKGKKDMVILPYKDRLQLFSKYLQQLVMESLGKEKDTEGRVVHQGIAVYGNKGSTDQHAYVQQLRDGVSNFFVTFIEVLKDRNGESIAVEPDITSGDYLNGLLMGTREALSQNGRPSITITVPEVCASVVGQLIALYERAVGFYGSLVHINAYNQPGVEAGKKAAAGILKIKRELREALRHKPGDYRTAEAWAADLKAPDQTEIIFKLLEHIVANGQPDFRKIGASSFYSTRYGYEKEAE